MQLDYLKSAIETIDLVKNLTIYIKETPTVNKEITSFLREIFEKAEARISSSSLGKDLLDIDIKTADTKGKSPNYWMGVRDTANLVMKKRSALSDGDFNVFLSQTKQRLEVQLKPEEKIISPLEEMLSGVKPEVSYQEPTKVIPDPAPTPIQREVKQYEEIKPVEKAIQTPTPVEPSPSPVITEPVIPEQEPVTPDPALPTSPEIPADMMAELTKPVGTNQQSPTQDPQSFQDKSLADMLLQKEETPSNVDTTESDEDQMLSMTLREALKILKDEDED